MVQIQQLVQEGYLCSRIGESRGYGQGFDRVSLLVADGIPCRKNEKSGRKDGWLPKIMNQTEDYKVAEFEGSHGLAHTRLATESRVDICYSHPFWARPFPDIAVVHNGQLTNHNKLRRSLQRRGYEFSTTNDSEVIAVFIADQLLNGLTLEESLIESIEQLDGTFTYLISTTDGIGFAKDRFSTKPLIVAENKSFVAMASEEVALHSMISEDTHLYEPTARAVQTWHR